MSQLQPPASSAVGPPSPVSPSLPEVESSPVSVPVLEGTGEAVNSLELDWNGTGNFAAYWDGLVRDTNRRAASGVYVYQLTVNGQTQSKRMTVIR